MGGLFDGSFMGEFGEIAENTCGMLLNMLAGVPGTEGAYGMCECIMTNALNVAFNNFDMSAIGGAMECVGKTQEYIGMVMAGGYQPEGYDGQDMMGDMVDHMADHDADDHDDDDYDDHDGSGDHDDDDDDDDDDDSGDDDSGNEDDDDDDDRRR